MMRLFLSSFFLLVLLLISAFPGRVFAHLEPVEAVTLNAPVAQINCPALAPVEWREARTRAFAILYPVQQEALAHTLFSNFGDTIDAEYLRFQNLFETSLTLPISIRIYPTENHYYCLNAQPPEVAPGATHSHIGSREIALMGENINSQWISSYLNVFRYEQAALFVEQISNGKAPPGLQAAVGFYAQNPFETFQTLHLPQTGGSGPNNTWRSLWEDETSRTDLWRGVQSTTTVAYLLDVYGWEPFLTFLQSLSTSEGYRHALTSAYGLEFRTMQDQWQEYYPLYFNGRWQAHILYNYDLSPHQKLIEAGAYADADKELRDVVSFLEKTRQDEKVAQAQSLLNQARTGLEAGALITQSRQALQRGEYQRSLDLVDQAHHKYVSLGNFHRLDELSAYRSQVSKILALHVELEDLGAQISSGGNAFLLTVQLSRLSRRMGELGDVHGQTQARDLAQLLETRKQNQQFLLSLGVLTLVLALLAYRIWLMRLKPEPEATL